MFTNLPYRMSRGRTLAAACATAAVAVAALAPFALPGSASAAVNGAHQSHKVRYCLTEVAKIHPPRPATRVIGRICSDRHEPGSVLPIGANMRQETLLVTFFQNEDYGGSFDSVGGHDGPCDIDGYGFSNLTLTNFNVNGISSYKLFSNCKISSYWDETGFTGNKRSSFRGDNRFVGATWNDRVFSMRTWS